MDNIFENAKFGDRFRTRDGQMVIYGKRSIFREELHWIHSKDNHTYRVYDDGYVSKDKEDDLDIVSLWQEPIDEKELEEMALHDVIEYNKEIGNVMTPEQEFFYQEGFNAGYRKAKES